MTTYRDLEAAAGGDYERYGNSLRAAVHDETFEWSPQDARAAELLRMVDLAQVEIMILKARVVGWLEELEVLVHGEDYQ